MHTFSSFVAKQFEKAMTPAEKEKLYAAIGYQENSSAPIYPVTVRATSF